MAVEHRVFGDERILQTMVSTYIGLNKGTVSETSDPMSHSSMTGTGIPTSIERPPSSAAGSPTKSAAFTRPVSATSATKPQLSIRDWPKGSNLESDNLIKPSVSVPNQSLL